MAQPVTQDLAVSPLSRSPGQHLPSRLQGGCCRSKCHGRHSRTTHKIFPLVFFLFYLGEDFLKFCSHSSAGDFPFHPTCRTGAHRPHYTSCRGEDGPQGVLRKVVLRSVNRGEGERPVGRSLVVSATNFFCSCL